jgi:TnpA family transposase
MRACLLFFLIILCASSDHRGPRCASELAELNKGEARNALARAVCFHRLGRLCDRAVEAQQYRASGLALVTAAIALWNTVYLDRALNDLRCGGEMIPEATAGHNRPATLPMQGDPASRCDG